jgi:glycosyltransferase involved in cell wall biosynthesis
MAVNEAKDMRLLMVTWKYLPEMGGIPTHVHEVARRLAAGGVDITVLATDLSGELPKDEVMGGVRVLRVQAWPRKRDYFFAPGMYRIIKNGNWNLMHCQGYQTLVPPVAMFAAWRAKIPYVATFHAGGHSSQVRKLIRVVQWEINAPLLARAARLVVNAEWEAKFFRKRLRLHKQTFVRIPNGGSLPDVARSPAPLSGEGPLIVSVGRLERYKGHHRIINALPKVREVYPDVRLRIVGSGPYEEELNQLARELGVADCVEIGPIPMSDRKGMASLLAHANLFVLLSAYEGHPIAVIEALAVGCPALVSDPPGLQEFADRGFARSISLKSSPEATAAAMVAQLREPLIPEFTMPSWDECASDLLALYNETLEGR